jgi:hypothetical protein
MTVNQIAQAFHSGHLNARTPLWPPGATGWQVLGNFEQFQMHPAAYAGATALAQFEEADDDPTRMWTGGELPDYSANYAPSYGEPAEPRPAVRTGTRPVASAQPPSSAQPSSAHTQAAYPAPLPPPSMPSAPRPAPTASLPPSRSTAMPMSIPPVRRSRNNGLMLVAGLVGLVGLGSAVLAARGGLGNSEADVAAAETTASAPPSEAAEAAADSTPTAEPRTAEVAPAKYEDAPAAAGSTANDAPAAAAPAAKPADEVKAEAPAADGKSDDGKSDEAGSQKAAASEPTRPRDDVPARKASYRSTPKRATAKPKSLALARVERAERPEKVERAEKAEKPERAERAPEKAEKAEASAEAAKAAPASGAVNEAAAAALANSANLAASCRPRGGPAGAGKARVIYSNDGEVQSVEILTAKFRDTLTGSCVRMVFRRAKIPPFKGEPPSFIKTFTIPEE